MKKILKRLATGFLAFATIVTALPTTAVHASEKQYWTESAERVGIVEKVMNDGSIGSTFNEGHMTVEGEDAFCVDINTNFRNGYKTRADASTRMSYDQISDVALSIEYVNQYVQSHSGLSSQHIYLLKQCVVWQRLSVHLGWQCDNVRASYDEIPKAIQDEVYAGAKAFASENKERYECGGYIYSGEGQDIGQFWAKLAVGNATLKKTSSNASITDGNGLYSIAGATYGVYSDKDCTKQLATLTTDNSGNTDTVEVKAGTVYIKELSAPVGYKVDSTVYSLNVEAGKTATLNVSDTPKVTDTLIELFKIDMETQKDAPQGDASLEGAEFTWKFYAGHYTADNLPSEPTKTWVTKTIAEKDSDGTIHYVSRLSDEYKVSGDSFYTQDGKNVLPLGTLTVEETKAPNGYLLDGAYMQTDGSEEQIKGMYLTQITEDGDIAVLSGSNQYHVSDKVIRGGVKIQKRDLETSDTKGQGSATLKDAEFEIISLNDNAVLVEGKLYSKNEVVKTILTDIEGVASTSADLLPYGKYRIEESKAPEGYLTDGAKPIEFEITEDGKIVDLTGTDTSIYNQVKRGDLEGVKIGAGTHQRLAGVPFRITSKTTGESHIIVTDDNGQFSTSSDWASHKNNTNAGKTSEDGIWFGTSEPDDSKGALIYDTYIIEELRCEGNKGFELIPAFEIVVSRNNVTVDLGTLTDECEKEITIHTTATGKDGEKSIVAGKEVTIVDTVTLDGLEKGTKYQLKGWQMLKEENAELLIDGQRVESDYTFTADSEEMKIEIEYTFNASSLGGQNLVTFEELYDLSNEDEPVKVAEHKDIDDEGQTVLITERIISIHTTATSEDGKKEIEAGKDVTIIDTVTLDGLEIGTKYQLKGWQMTKDENAELIINGERVENDYTFTADSESMEVQIAFTFDASELGGKELVTFEELYDLSNPDEPTKVTEHKDIEDDGQTVTITEVPEMPEEPTEPEQPTTPDTPSKTTDAPKTGDNTNIALFLGAGTGAMAGSVLSSAGSKQSHANTTRKRDNTSFGSRAGSAVGAVLDTKNKVKDKATAVKENIKDMPTQTAYAVHSAKEKAKSSVSDFKRGIVQGQETRQSERADKLQQHRQNIADKRMELQKAQEAKQAGRKTDGSATTGATRPHDRPVTASPASKTDTGKAQEIKRSVTTDKVHTEPTTPQPVKERPLASGTEKKTSVPVSQPQGQRQTVRRTVEQTSKTERTLSSQQKQTNYQKNQQTVKKTTTKKGRRK